jgi:hypothetical protein
VRSNPEVHGRSYDLRHNLLERVSIIVIKNTNRMKTYYLIRRKNGKETG